MKRWFCVLVTAFLLLALLVGCSPAEETDGPREVEYFGTAYWVDTEAGTVSDGVHTYGYTFSGDTASYQVDITYPDGSTYWFTMQNGHGAGGWSDDYDRERYVDGDTLCEVIRQTAPEPERNRPVLLILLLAAVGAFNLAAPRAAWYAEWGWRFKEAEPSDTALTLHRVSGGIAVAVAVILLLL